MKGTTVVSGFMNSNKLTSNTNNGFLAYLVLNCSSVICSRRRSVGSRVARSWARLVSLIGAGP